MTNFVTLKRIICVGVNGAKGAQVEHKQFEFVFEAAELALLLNSFPPSDPTSPDLSLMFLSTHLDKKK